MSKRLSPKSVLETELAGLRNDKKYLLEDLETVNKLIDKYEKIIKVLGEGKTHV